MAARRVDIRTLLGSDWETEYDQRTALYRCVHARGLEFRTSAVDLEVDVARAVVDALLDAVEDHVKGRVAVRVSWGKDTKIVVEIERLG